MTIKFDNNLPIQHAVSPVDTSSSTVFVDTISLNKYRKTNIGKRVELIFELDNEFLSLTEITFDNEPTVIHNTTVITMTTTNCPLGEYIQVNEKEKYEKYHLLLFDAK